MNDGGAGQGEGDRGKLELAHELRAIEAELAALRPRADRLDRDRLFFLAGQASVGLSVSQPAVPPGGWAWPTSFAGMTMVATALFVVLMTRQDPALTGAAGAHVQETEDQLRAVAPPKREPTPPFDATRPSMPATRQAVAQPTMGRGAPWSRALAAHRPAPTGDAFARPPLRQRLLAAGNPSYLFEHLVADPSYPQAVTHRNPTPPDEQINEAIWSPRSLRELLQEDSQDDSTSDRQSLSPPESVRESSNPASFAGRQYKHDARASG